MIQLLLLADNKKLTAAMKAKKSSPAVGWITSAPKMIAGASKTRYSIMHRLAQALYFALKPDKA
jgi:hypothetical protein